MRKTYKYRLYPKREQLDALIHTVETCRDIYNTALEQRVMLYRDRKKNISCYEQINQMKDAVPCDECLIAVHSQVRQDVIRRVDKAYKAFFRRCANGDKPGFPRYKGKDRYHSFTYPQSGFAILPGRGKHSKLKLSKIGSLEMRYHREIPDEACIKTCTIVRNNEKWYVCFSLMLPDVEPLADIGQPVGIDVGLEYFASLSDGGRITNPRYYQQAEEKLKFEQQRLSRKEKGSNNRRKQVKRIAVVHESVANKRNDYLHKVARQTVDIYPYIRVESLNIRNMLKNHRLAKSIADAGWGRFMNLLVCKAEEAGKRVEFVNPAGTSQTCPACGERVEKDLSVRTHICQACGFVAPRDIASAMVISFRAGTARSACRELSLAGSSTL